MADRRAREVVISTSCSAKLLRWRVCAGSEVREGSVLCFYEVTDKGEKPGSFITQPKLKSAFAGKVRKLLVAEGDFVAVGKPVMLIDEATECEHRMVMKELCCDCGVDLRKYEDCYHELHEEKNEPSMPTLASVPLIHNIPELKVCQEEAEVLGKKDEKRLLETRKLSLVVDLDQTLIHTTMELIPENMKDVHHFQLPGYPVWYHTKIRPGALEFLSRVSTLYELHIFTMGSRMYAHTIARLLDPEGKLFAYRIRSRDECFNAFSKSPDLRSLFPSGDGMVCIIDDREDVWNFARNLIHVKPYQYFKGVGDINAPPESTATPPNQENTTKEQEIYQQEKEVSKQKEDDGAVIEESNKLEEMKTEEFCEKKRSGENLFPNVEASVKKQEPAADTNSHGVEGSETEGIHETNEDSPRMLENGGDDIIDNEKEKNEVVEIKESGEDKPDNEQNKNGNTEVVEAKTPLEGNNEITREESQVSSCEREEIKLAKSQNHNYEFGDDDDDYLLHLEDILHRIHVVFYETVDNIKSATNVDEIENNPKITKYCSRGTTTPDTKLIITELRREVLRGVNIVFTGVIPTSVRQEESYPCRVACALGAKVSHAISTSEDTDDRSRVTTHVIAGKLGTEKSLRAVQSQGIKLVNPSWLYCCNERWEWVDERLFHVEGLERYKQQIRDQETPCGRPQDGKSESAHEIEGAETKTRTDSVSSADMLMSTLNPLLSFSPTEVEAMDKEVEDLMNASEGESDLIGSVSDSSSLSDSDDSEMTDNRKRKHEKDNSNESPNKKIKVVNEVEENEDDNDDEEVGEDASNSDSDGNHSPRSSPSDGDDDMAAMLEAELALS